VTGDWQLVKWQRVANGEWFFGGQCSCTAENFQAHRGNVPSSFVNLWMLGLLPDRKNFGALEDVPSNFVSLLQQASFP